MFSHQVWTDRYVLSTSEDSRQVWTDQYVLSLPVFLWFSWRFILLSQQ